MEEESAKVRRLHYTEHWPVGTIATQLGLDEDRIRRILGLARRRTARAEGPVEPRAGMVDSYVPFIITTLQEYPTLRATRLYDMLKDRGYEGSPRRLREVIAQRGLRPQRPKESYARLELLIGEQAQVDWAHVCKLNCDGSQRTVWMFVMVLSWSRALWAEFVLDLTVESLMRSLVRAGRYHGGVTRQWLFDNPKTIVVQRAGNTVRFNADLLALAGAYHVAPSVCAVRKPNQKGRVERSIRYLRERFLAGRVIRDLDLANQHPHEFLIEVSNRRPHPELPGRTVADCLAEERQRLLPLPQVPPSTDLIRAVRVDKTGYVRFDRNAYAVPGKAGEMVTLAVSDREVHFSAGTEHIISHPRSWGARNLVGRTALLEHVSACKPAVREGLAKSRLEAACARFSELQARWVDAGRNVGSLTAKAVRLLDQYGPAVCADAIEEILDRGTHDPGALAMVCERLREARFGAPRPQLVLPEHVPDRDVLPHDLETYDDF